MDELSTIENQYVGLDSRFLSDRSKLCVQGKVNSKPFATKHICHWVYQSDFCQSWVVGAGFGVSVQLHSGHTVVNAAD